MKAASFSSKIQGQIIPGKEIAQHTVTLGKCKGIRCNARELMSAAVAHVLFVDGSTQMKMGFITKKTIASSRTTSKKTSHAFIRELKSLQKVPSCKDRHEDHDEVISSPHRTIGKRRGDRNIESFDFRSSNGPRESSSSSGCT